MILEHHLMILFDPNAEKENLKMKTLLLTLLSSIFLISTAFTENEPPRFEGGNRGPGFANFNDEGTGFKHSNDHKADRRSRRKKIADLKMFEKECPELAAKIKNLKKDNPTVFKEFIRQLRSRSYRRIIFGLKSKDEGTKELTKEYLNNELQSLILSAKYKENKDKSLKQEISQILYKSFEIKTELQHKFVEQMETRIVKVKEMLDKRIEQKDKIIDQRVSELTENKDILDW